jgi:hypothetical protein
MAMVAPETVWAVRIGVSNEDAKGLLTLEDTHLVFSIEEGSLRIALSEITKVKRVLGSPILMVNQDGARPAKFAFFFVKPPPLEPQKPRQTKRKVRKQGTAYLGQQNRELKPLLVAWERDIRQAIGRAEANSR